MPVLPVLRPYDSWRGVELLGDMWRLSKGARTALCTLRTHPLGWELVTLLNNDVKRTQVCKTVDGVLDTSNVWRLAWEAKGWK
jgi:hypothetical protein